MRIFGAAILAGVIATAGCSSSTKVMLKPFDGRGQVRRVAVVDVKNVTGDVTNDVVAASLSPLLIDELGRTGAYQLIERQRLDALLAELKLNMTGLVDEDTAKLIGKQLGVDAFLFSDLVSVTTVRAKQTIGIMWTEGKRTDAVMSSRLVNVETGAILRTAHAAVYVKQRAWVAFWFARLGSIADDAAIVRKAAELCVRKLASELQ